MILCTVCKKRKPRFKQATCLDCQLEIVNKDPWANRPGVVATAEEFRRLRRGETIEMTDTSGKGKTPKKAPTAVCTGCKRDKEATGRLYAGLCSDCRNKPTPEDPPSPPAPPIAPKAPSGPSEQVITDPALGKTLLEGAREAELRLTIDFNDHPDLLKKLQALARKDFRTPEGQILYILKTIVGESKAGDGA